jgi:hypothetical protein
MTVPGKIRVAAASEAMAAPKNRNTATAVNPRGGFWGGLGGTLDPDPY